MTSKCKNPDHGIDNRIGESLVTLRFITKEYSFESHEPLNFLQRNSERYVELYHEDGLIATLTHQVILNRKISHFFCISLRSLKELWEIEEVQEAFAEALRMGQSHLADPISFLPNYRNIPRVQEALAENIRVCKGNLFPVHFAGAMGISEHPSIQSAILDTKDDILACLRNYWHCCSLVQWVPVLVEDEDVKQVIAQAKPKLLKALREDELLVDPAILIEKVDWIREDPDVIQAISDRLLDESKSRYTSLTDVLKKTELFKTNPVLQNAFERLPQNIQEWFQGH